MSFTAAQRAGGRGRYHWPAVWLAGLCLALGVIGAGRAGPAAAQSPEAVCVDGGQSGQPFAGVRCLKTVATIDEAVRNLKASRLVVVRAFASSDENSIDGLGTYRDPGLQKAKFKATAANPVIIQAEGFTPGGDFERPIVDGAVRVTGAWERTPGTQHTWQTPWSDKPGSFGHSACVDRIWVSRKPGRTRLADFPLTRPLLNQGNNTDGDCENNTVDGQPMTPAQVDAYAGSYEWLEGVLYVHLPGDEDPNEYTVEVPYQHTFSPQRGSSGLIVRGFRVYHTVNGIDLWHCGTGRDDRCEASYNETSYNTHFGLQPGPYGLLAWNSGQLNTIQLIKITSDHAEIANNQVGPQLAHGLKFNEVQECSVHDNVVFGNVYTVRAEDTQAGWKIMGTRDATAGLYLKNGTTRCDVAGNTVYGNKIGIYLRNDGDKRTELNTIHDNVIIYNDTAVAWRDAGLWDYNTLTGNLLNPGAVLKWGDASGRLLDFQTLTGVRAGG